MVSIIDVLRSAGFVEIYNSNANPSELQYMTYTYTSYFNTSVFSGINIFYPLSEPDGYAIDVIFTSIVAKYSISPCDNYIFWNVGVSINGELVACVDPQCAGQSYTFTSAVTNTGGCQSSLVISGYVGGGQKLPLLTTNSIYYHFKQYPYVGAYFSFDFAGLGSPNQLYKLVIEIEPTYIDWWRYSSLNRFLNLLYYMMFGLAALMVLGHVIDAARHFKHSHS